MQDEATARLVLPRSGPEGRSLIMAKQSQAPGQVTEQCHTEPGPGSGH